MKRKGGRGASRGRKGLRRIVPFGKVSRSQELRENAQDALRRVGNAGSHALQTLKERVPRGASQAKDWTREKFHEHPLTVAAGALVAGIAGASMLPVSDRERSGISEAADRLRHLRERGGTRLRARMSRAREAVQEQFQHAEQAGDELLKSVREVLPSRRRAQRPKAKRGSATSKKRTQSKKTTGRRPVRRKSSAGHKRTTRRAR